MLYQTLFTYKYDNGGRPEQINVDQLGDYPTEYVYRVLAGESRPKKVLISDLQSETSDYTIYCVDEEGETVRANKSRTLGSTWAGKMIRSYQERNPEQKTWFDMITVNTIAERDTLQNDPDFEPESWIRVRKDENGQSHEYVLSANRQFWVDAGVVGLSQTSGSLARDELYSRLSSGYLFDTFGPSGQDKSVCDFVYAFAINGNLTARAWTKSGDTARWDFGDGSPVLNNGVPAHTFVSGNNIVTISVEDSFNTVTRYYLSNFTFVGAMPKMDFSNVTNTGGCFFECMFSGALPYLDVSNVTTAGSTFKNCPITSTQRLDFVALTGSSTDMLSGTRITDKVGKITIKNTTESSITIAGMFRNCTITSIDVDLVIINPELITGSVMFWQCYNLEELSKVDFSKLSYANWLSTQSATESFIADTNLNNIYPFNNENVYSPIVSALDGARSYQNFVKHVPLFIVSDNDTLNYSSFQFIPINNASTAGTILTSQSVKNIVRYIYNRRFATKQITSKKLFINLQPLTNENMGKYRNTTVPRSTNEFLYKLVENPDGEDINAYAILNSTTNIDKPVIKYDVNVNSTSLPVIFDYEDLFLDGVGLTIDWGDGNSDSITFGFEDSRPLRFGKTLEHTYDTTGDYTISVTLNQRNASSLEDTPLLLSGAMTITNITMNADLPISMFSTFEGISTVENIYFNENTDVETISYVWGRETFRDCTSLRHIDPFYMFSSTESFGDLNNMFANTGSIESVVLKEVTKPFSIANNQLDDVALNALFEGLGDVTDEPQTVTVTGNPGIGVGVYDTTIATNKGWTVVDA